MHLKWRVHLFICIHVLCVYADVTPAFFSIFGSQILNPVAHIWSEVRTVQVIFCLRQTKIKPKKWKDQIKPRGGATEPICVRRSAMFVTSGAKGRGFMVALRSVVVVFCCCFFTFWKFPDCLQSSLYMRGCVSSETKLNKQAWNKKKKSKIQ